MQTLPRPPSVYEAVQDALKSHILESGLRPGDMLEPEGRIAERLGVSRVTVREAVKALSSLGILESRRGSGVFVREFSFDAVLDALPYGLLTDLRRLDEVLEIRRVLEAGLIERVVDEITPSRLGELRAVLARMWTHAGDPDALAADDRAFHRALLADLGNETALKLLDVFWRAFRTAVERVDLRTDAPARTIEDHAAIVEAVAGGDAVGARRALEHHYAGIAGRLRRAQLGAQPPRRRAHGVPEAGGDA
jgi:DNA-binding FadR family transcriptional regulator